jgi:tetratricopeptide (TPR) repeat protein
MTKYRIRLKNGRVIGPFVLDQLHELKAKGHIQGKEEAQIFPTGNWAPIQNFDFFPALMDENKTEVFQAAPKEETFVIDLTKLRNHNAEKEIEKIDVTSHPVQELTETIQLTAKTEIMPPPKANPSTQTKFEMELEANSKSKGAETGKTVAKDKPLTKPAEIIKEPEEDEDRSDRTALNPVAQQDLERIRREQKAEEERLRAQAEKERHEEEARALAEIERKREAADESTQMLSLDKIKHDLLVVAQEEEVSIEKEMKAIQKRKKQEEAKAREEEEEEDEEEEDEAKKKKIKIIGILAACAIAYAILFPSDDKPQKPQFQPIEPRIVFPIPFDKADSKKAKIELDKAKQLFAAGDYLSLIKAGLLLKSAYENNIESQETISLLVRIYAEQLKYSKNKQVDAQVVFNLIQAKRPFLTKDPNGVIGLNLFYMAIGKYEAAADVVSKYLKLYPKNVVQDLFAVYLKTLLRIGKIDLARQFNQALEKAPQKNRYTYDALIAYALMNQETDKAMEYVDDAIKNNPKLATFYLKKAELLIKQKDFKNAEFLLGKAETLNLESNNLYRAKFLELNGLLLAFKGDVQTATAVLRKSLSIEDSNELRMKLADLSSSDNPENDTDKLISESKAIKLLMQAKDFYDKRNYELALSSAAKATDAMVGHIPSELFLAKVQLRLGLASPALKTLRELNKKYPDNRSINLALIDAYIDTYKFNDAKNLIATIAQTDIRESYEFASANGRLYIQMGDSLQAISWLRNSINMNPLNDQDIYLLSEILIKRANFDAAKLLLNKCMELDPVNPDYRIAYSKIVYEQQDDQAAIGYLLGLLDEFGESPKILSEIAIFYYRAGKVKDFQAYKEKLEKLPTKDKALHEFMIRAALLDERFDEIPGLVENLLQVEPGALEAMMTAGRVLFEDGKLVEAAKWFRRIQDKLDTYPKVQYYIAKIKYLSKDYEGALKDVEADIKANGENDADLTLMAQIYSAQDKLIEAENLYKKAQKINPKSYESLMGLADISTKRNNFDLALDLYKKAQKEKIDEPIIHRSIGDVYRRLGQGALAVESYKLYLEMAPEASDKAQIQSYIKLMQ